MAPASDIQSWSNALQAELVEEKHHILSLSSLPLSLFLKYNEHRSKHHGTGPTWHHCQCLARPTNFLRLGGGAQREQSLIPCVFGEKFSFAGFAGLCGIVLVQLTVTVVVQVWAPIWCYQTFRIKSRIFRAWQGSAKYNTVHESILLGGLHRAGWGTGWLTLEQQGNTWQKISRPDLILVVMDIKFCTMRTGILETEAFMGVAVAQYHWQLVQPVWVTAAHLQELSTKSFPASSVMICDSEAWYWWLPAWAFRHSDKPLLFFLTNLPIFSDIRSKMIQAKFSIFFNGRFSLTVGFELDHRWIYKSACGFKICSSDRWKSPLAIPVTYVVRCSPYNSRAAVMQICRKSTFPAALWQAKDECLQAALTPQGLHLWSSEVDTTVKLLGQSAGGKREQKHTGRCPNI